MSNSINKIIVLGHSGFIGKKLMALLSSLPSIEVMGLSKEDGDFCDSTFMDSLSELVDSRTYIVFLAGIKKQFGDTEIMFNENMLMIQNFCNLIKISLPAQVLFFSSAAVYGEDVHNLSINENTLPDPVTYYGISKYVGERLMYKQCSELGIAFTVLRPPTIYGSEDTSNTYGPVAFVNAYKGNTILKLWGDATELRDFIHVKDVARLTMLIIQNGYHGILNLASGKSYSFKEMLDWVDEFSENKIEIKYQPRSKRKVDHQFDISLLSEIVGHYSYINLKEGIAELYE